MSVTFFPELAPVVGYRLADYFGGRDPRLFGSYDEAVTALVTAREARTVLPGCTDPEEIAASGDAYRVDVVTGDGDDTGPERNMVNANARSVLSLLGYEEDGEVLDLVGSCGAEEFLGRVLTARALAPVDAGAPAMESVGHGGATVVDCGRSPGYHQRALDGLEDLAHWCRDRQRAVCWS